MSDIFSIKNSFNRAEALLKDVVTTFEHKGVRYSNQDIFSKAVCVAKSFEDKPVVTELKRLSNIGYEPAYTLMDS